MRNVIVVILACCVTVGVASASETIEIPDLLLVEVQLGSAESASEEFVEIINTSSHATNLDGVELQYKSSNGSNWSTKAELNGDIAPYSRVLISNFIETATFDFSGGLSGTSGHLRLSYKDEDIDKLGWGEAVDPEEIAAETHDPGQSLKRLVDEDGYFVDSQNNSVDWLTRETPTPFGDPQVSEEVLEIIEEEVIAPEEAEKILGETIQPTHQLFITELLPDPVSPMTDAEHEFVELFNPNDFVVNLESYRIESGSEWRYGFTLGSYDLMPGEYLAVMSGDSGVSLSNSGSQVRIIGPDGNELDFVEYEKAKADQSWSKFGDAWEWAQITNNANNVRFQNETAEANDQSDEQASTLEKRDVQFAQNEQQASNSSTPPSGSLIDIEPEPQTANNWVLAGVGSMAVLYGLYEYRSNIRVRVQQCRRHFELRRENRAKS